MIIIVASILQPLGKRAKIHQQTCLRENNEKRKWIFIGKDGGVLVPIIKLISSVYRCNATKQYMDEKTLIIVYVARYTT